MIDYVLANSADPDKLPHCVAFHLGLHCLPKYRSQRVNMFIGHKRDANALICSLARAFVIDEIERTRAQNYNASLKLWTT